MSSQGELAAYTVPSNWITTLGDYTVTADKPYKRIVGLEASPAETLWVPAQIERDPRSAYTQSEAEKLILPTTPLMTDRLARFFKRFMVQESLPADDNYNCYRFAFWMDGNEKPSHNLAIFEAESLILKAPGRWQRLGLGQAGVFGGLCRNFRSVSEADHAVVGLGQERNDCLMVSGPQGHLGLGSYDEIRHRFMRTPEGRQHLKRISNFGLYSLEPLPSGPENFAEDVFDD